MKIRIEQAISEVYKTESFIFLPLINTKAENRTCANAY